MITRRAEVKYAPDWTPQSFALDATVNGGDVTATSTFTKDVVRTIGTNTGAPYSREHTLSPQAVVLMPSSFFGAFEAVSRRLVSAPAGTELRAYVVPTGEPRESWSRRSQSGSGREGLLRRRSFRGAVADSRLGDLTSASPH
jgi:hypothetical protein